MVSIKHAALSAFVATGLASAPSLLGLDVAHAQGSPTVDSDADGVMDDIDALPCDDRVSARVYAPADRTYGMLLFEDLWPDKGDYDFNDAVIAYNQTLLYDSGAQLTGMRIELSVMAVGARFQNGLALRFPNTPKASVVDLTFTLANVVNSAAGEVRLDPNAADATIILTDDLHALFGVESTREWVNTDPNLPAHAFADMVVDVTFDPGHNLSAADAPFDVFIFNPNAGTEVHRPRYGGTPNLDPTLFNTRDDGSTPGRYFVTPQGVPYALELPELANYPKEGVAIDTLYPQVVTYGATSGAQATDFYRNPTAGYAYGLTPPRALQGAAAADTSCFVAEPGVCGAASGVGSVDAPASNLCGFGVASAVSTSSGMWRWDCTGNYSTPTACTAPDYVCQPNLSSSCAISGGTGAQVCNGSGTGYGTCTVTSCNSGYYQSGNACYAQVCSPGSSASCAISNGTGSKTCDNLGSAYGGCTVVSCNSGYTRSGNTCVASSSPGSPAIPWPAAPQLYCNGNCSWDPGSGCGQGDADIFCRLKTGNTSNYALSFTTGVALDQPGFSCPNYGTNLGSFSQYGGPRQRGGYGVWTQSTSIRANHGAGQVITSVNCAY